MSELSGPLTEWLEQVIPQEAGQLHKSYRLIPREDFEQELWATALRKRSGLERLLEQGAIGVMRRRIREGGFKLVNEDDRYRRACKAASAGYSVLDEQFYTTGVIEILLAWYLDNGITERPPQGRELQTGRVSGGGDGSSDYLAMMLDIDWALSRVRPYHRHLLERYYSFPQGSGGFTHNEIAGRLGIQPDALRMRRNRALGAMRARLGGRNPWTRRDQESAAQAAERAA